jgi:hypothetical protein
MAVFHPLLPFSNRRGSTAVDSKPTFALRPEIGGSGEKRPIAPDFRAS